MHIHLEKVKVKVKGKEKVWLVWYVNRRTAPWL